MSTRLQKAFEGLATKAESQHATATEHQDEGTPEHEFHKAMKQHWGGRARGHSESANRRLIRKGPARPHRTRQRGRGTPGRIVRCGTGCPAACCAPIWP